MKLLDRALRNYPLRAFSKYQLGTVLDLKGTGFLETDLACDTEKPGEPRSTLRCRSIRSIHLCCYHPWTQWMTTTRKVLTGGAHSDEIEPFQVKGVMASQPPAVVLERSRGQRNPHPVVGGKTGAILWWPGEVEYTLSLFNRSAHSAGPACFPGRPVLGTILGSSWAILGHLGTILGHLGNILSDWTILGPS